MPKEQPAPLPAEVTDRIQQQALLALLHLHSDEQKKVQEFMASLQTLQNYTADDTGTSEG